MSNIICFSISQFIAYVFTASCSYKAILRFINILLAKDCNEWQSLYFCHTALYIFSPLEMRRGKKWIYKTTIYKCFLLSTNLKINNSTSVEQVLWMQRRHDALNSSDYRAKSLFNDDSLHSQIFRLWIETYLDQYKFLHIVRKGVYDLEAWYCVDTIY